MITVSTTSAVTRAKRAFNFNAGPAALPLPVLERIREELLDYRGTGMSVMELSHRSAEFEAINTAAEQNLRKLLAIPEEYAVIFVQGGGSMQFAMVPMNLCLPGKPVDILHTGMWTGKALGELKKDILHNVAASTEAEKFVRVPRAEEIKLSADASYTYFCTNNTIEGTQYHQLPVSAAPLVADMSSDIASRPVDVSEVWADLCRGAEESGAERRDGGDRKERPGGARGQKLADAAAIPHTYQGEVAVPHAAYVCGVHPEPGDGVDGGGGRSGRDAEEE